MNLKTCPLGLGIMSDKVKEYMALRNAIRQEMKSESDENKKQELNQRQTAMKLVCNSGLGVVVYTRYCSGSLFSSKEFNKVKKGKKGPFFNKAKALQEKYGNDNMFILTARPAEAAQAIQIFLEGVGLNVKLENIIGLEDGRPQAKAKVIVEKAAENAKVTMKHFEDAVKKVREQKDLKIGQKVELSAFR